ncbi:hypothetical protein CONPUDRAFT_149291 [Coniophora puteana RWD-64-598 SS2]|uniref:Uncharacterized protein n=1 Tax=Coniophora puteana (strain RWD-64-598) TaxID=741705 RepID=A0A5M3N7J5_CONPW|nr:uncharacterized protein CONPUDRAFT_149291 [Coniophora puteana RWD-64-598 SS2]EIW87258.1 hypothetical protein CONPUDRAFT_149291 [Coniophora puteana RWD-64-598 SS2]
MAFCTNLILSHILVLNLEKEAHPAPDDISILNPTDMGGTAAQTSVHRRWKTRMALVIFSTQEVDQLDYIRSSWHLFLNNPALSNTILRSSIEGVLTKCNRSSASPDSQAFDQVVCALLIQLLKPNSY